ncbi:tripartite-type tricarboxylate transporter receptor subunit TctC [Arthrobacter sp. CAN_A214]|uniref:Bug family tripartite tricarboxylate transporter substrate binding protein n=1 Tax=Arthrobacter sp. CAN_A214 TaxID=2787720 RepID=UPI0018C9A0AA
MFNPKSATRSTSILSVAAVFALTLSACGGNVANSGGSEDGSDFPSGPVTLTIGQDPGGSTDLIGRAIAENASEPLGVPIPVVNKPGANGALATQEVANATPDGQTLILLNASLIAITPLAVGEDEAVTLDDLEIITGISQDDYVLVANAESEYKTVEDIVAADKSFNFATTGVGTGSQLAQALLFKQAGVEGTDVPFDGGSPAMTALLGNQVDFATIQLGEAMPQIEAGTLTPIVTFSEERNQYLPDVPTAVEGGYDVPVSQFRAVAAPKGTPEPVLEELRTAISAAFETEEYKEFNESNLFTPHEVDGAQVTEEWEANAAKYKELVEKYEIDLGGEQ